MFSAEDKAQFPGEGHSGTMILLGRENERPELSLPSLSYHSRVWGEGWCNINGNDDNNIVILIIRIAILMGDLLIIYTSSLLVITNYGYHWDHFFLLEQHMAGSGKGLKMFASLFLSSGSEVRGRNIK